MIVTTLLYIEIQGYMFYLKRIKKKKKWKIKELGVKTPKVQKNNK